MNFFLSYRYEAFKSLYEAIDFIDKYTNFSIVGILSSKSSIGYIEYEKRKLKEYFTNSSLDSFTIVNNISNSFDFNNSITFKRNLERNLCIFFCKIEKIESLNIDILIRDSIKLNFTMAFIFDIQKSKWQNEILVDNYRSFNRPYEHLSKKWDKHLSPILGEIIDITKNPGHFVETYTCGLMAAPEIWFGPGIWEYFNKEKILQFPNAEASKEILPNVVYVKLFDWKAPDYETSEILKIQKQFRDWSGMNEVEQKLEEKCGRGDSNYYITE